MTEEMVRLSCWIPAVSKDFILRVSAEQKISQTDVIRHLLIGAKCVYEENESRSLMLWTRDLEAKIEFYQGHVKRVQTNLHGLRKQLKAMSEDWHE